MGNHIATEETFLVGAPKVKGKCWVCGNTSQLELGWVGAKCRICGAMFNLEDTIPDLVRQRRDVMNLTRRQMSELSGYKPSSIKRYEWVRCTKPYFKKTLRLLRKFLKKKLS